MNTQEPGNAELIAAALSQLRGRRPHGPRMHAGGGPHGAHAHHGGRPGGGRKGGLALMRMLQTLIASAQPLSVSDIGEAIGVDQPRASRLVQQAAIHGLVEREVDPEDARRTRIVLTDHGRDFAKRATEEQREALDAALAALDEQEQETLARLLTKLAANWQV